MDLDKDQMVNFNELKLGLHKFGHQLPDADVQILMEDFIDFANHNAFELLTRYGTTHLVLHDKVAQRLWCPCPDYYIPAVSIKDYSTAEVSW
ncbi:unnamed protein product [Urochloa humidicola]